MKTYLKFLYFYPNFMDYKISKKLWILINSYFLILNFIKKKSAVFFVFFVFFI